MDWQAADDSWTGDTPGEDPGLPGPPRSPGPPGPHADFGHAGAWAEALPSAALAVALEKAAGPGELYDGAGTDALVGITRQWAAIESWAAASKLAALRAMTREDADGRPLLRRRVDLPDGWDDSLTYEISGALAMGPVSAGNLASLAWTLGTRLAGIGRLLAAGMLTLPKARLVAQIFEPLAEDEAVRAEALILGDLAGKTYPQVEKLAWRAALAVAPDAAERRRTRAERDARVTVFREDSGTVGLSGRDLPAADALAGHANVLARAGLYAASGMFPGHADSSLHVLAYLDLLNGVSTQDRIAFAANAAVEPPSAPGPDDGDGGTEDPGDGEGGPDEPDDSGPDEPDDSEPDEPDDSGPDEPDDSEPDEPDDSGRNGPHEPAGPTEPGDSEPQEPDHGGPGKPEDPQGPPSSPLAEVTVPLATLQRQAERAGDNRLLGPLDPALARDLAAAAARSPRSRWEITVVDENGYATGYGIGRPRRGSGQEPPPTGPPGCELPARVNITITEKLLRQSEAQAAQPLPGSQPRPGAPPGPWTFTPGKPGTWTLTLPGGRPLAVRFDVVPTYDCDHRYQVTSYLPGDRLRRLVAVRDHECTWPPCSRAARESDFEHAVPYDKGGVTDACNAGARSRRCHQVKQMPGWTVTQPKPGWHVWTTPTGRSYVQEPWRYTALPAGDCRR